MKNKDDDECFKWAVTRALHMMERDNEIIDKILKIQAENLKWDGINFLATFQGIDRFENNNEIDVILFGTEQTLKRDKRTNKKIDEIILRTPKKEYEKVVQLLLISDGKNKHYCVVKNIRRLLSSQVTKSHGKINFCTFCLNGFRNEKSLENHLEYCSKNDCVKTVFPHEDKNEHILKFKNFQKMHKVPFAIYSDFECFLKH